MAKSARPSVLRDPFWRGFVDDYINDSGYWYQPKGLVISRSNLPLIKKRLVELARFEGKRWSRVQGKYTEVLVHKGLVELRKPRKSYTPADFAAISRMNKVVLNTLGLAWVDPSSTVFITGTGRDFLNARAPANVVQRQLTKYQFGNPSLGVDCSEFQLFPHLFLLDVLLRFPQDGISREEYVLFVSRAKSAGDAERVADRIQRYRLLNDDNRKGLVAHLKTIPVLERGRLAAAGRRSSIYHTIELNAPYALSFFAFPDYLCVTHRGQIMIQRDRLAEAIAVARKEGARAFYTEFASKKDWFSYYGDPARSGSELDAMEYYESRSDVDRAVRAFLVARTRGTAPRIDPGRYMELRVQEKMLEDLLEFNLPLLEEGLVLVGRQYQTLVGPIDLLAKDSRKQYVVIELKKSRASDRVIGQLQRYRGYVLQELARPGQTVRGMIVSRNVDNRLRYAVRGLRAEPVQLFQFKFQADVNEIV